MLSSSINATAVVLKTCIGRSMKRKFVALFRLLSTKNSMRSILGRKYDEGARLLPKFC